MYAIFLSICDPLTTTAKLNIISEKARFPTRYVPEFRKHFKGSFKKANNSMRLLRTPIEETIYTGRCEESYSACTPILKIHLKNRSFAIRSHNYKTETNKILITFYDNSTSLLIHLTKFWPCSYTIRGTIEMD